MEHAILEVVSDCYVESWRHLLKDIGLTNVFEYGVPSLGLPTMDLWSGTLDIRDRCFLLLLGNTLVPKNTCVSFIQSISHVRAAPQLFFLAQQSKSETFVLVLEATPTYTTCETGFGTVRHSELGHRGDLRQLHAHRECPGCPKKEVCWQFRGFWKRRMCWWKLMD